MPFQRTIRPVLSRIKSPVRSALAMVLVVGIVLVVGAPAQAHSFSYGMPGASNTIRPYDYNSQWQGPMDRALSNWNVTPTPAWITKSSGARNSVTAASYSDTYYGRYDRYLNLSGYYYQIKLNARTISRDASNFGNFVTSVFVHELGHSLKLGHNSVTSIMNDGRNRNSMTTPQQHDIDDVNAYY